MQDLTKWENNKLKQILKKKPYLSLYLRSLDPKEKKEYLKTLLDENNLITPKEINLQDIHDLYCDLLHIEDTNRIDIVLAVALSSKLDGIPIWLIIVGASGDMKSVQLNSIRTEETFILHNLTSKTLVNGYKDKEEHPDLAPELKDKIIIIPDMAQILKLPTVEKAEIWGQLRDLYDGFAGKMSGQGSRARYEGLKTTLLAGSTPAIDGQILVHQDLGTRELFYRTKGNKDKRSLMQKCIENEALEGKIGMLLTEITSTFISNQKIKRFIINEHDLEEIMDMATYLSYMRATGEIDSYRNTLRNDVYPEEPTRIIKQLKRIFMCLMNLDENYKSQKAIEILWEIIYSSSFPMRVKILNLLLNDMCEYSTSQISEILHIGKSTSQRELSILWNLNLVKCRREKTKIIDLFYEYWEVNKENKFIQKLIKDKEIRP